MAELVVSKKNIKSLLSLSDTGYTEKTYFIPEYQRPYRWSTDECETLWTDIVNFYSALKEPDAPQEYFLGTIVTCTDNGNKNDIDIIDGQQRITSLLLLLRAFYARLEESLKSMPDDDAVKGLMDKITPCIWRVDEMSSKVKDRKDLKIISKVALDKDNDDFMNILATGKEQGTKSSYNANYQFFIKQIKDFCEGMHPWKELCLCILNRCIVLPIECEDLSSALTIFGTLNNRGLPLSDSDIFKAELYKIKSTPQEKTAFTDSWKSLEETANDGGFTVNDIFRYYTHVIRSKNNVTDKEIGLRRFYAGNDQKFKAFKEEGFFEEIVDLANFWNTMNNNVCKFDEDNEFCTSEAIKFVHCLTTYPNDYWRCLVTVFYFKHRGEDDFKVKLEDFLRRMVAYLYVLFVLKPMVNEVKTPIFKFCVEVETKGDAVFQIEIPEDFAKRMDLLSQSSSKMVKPLILLNSYLYSNKQELITGKIDIEHILPKKWKEANYGGWDRDKANEKLESIGNKIPFEKRLNIQAGNDYFGEKKKKYCKSPIIEVQDLCKKTSNDWLKEDIEERCKLLCDRLITFFNDNLHPEQTAEVVEEILKITKNAESIVLQVVVRGGSKTYRMTTTKSVDKSTLSMQQLLSGNIPVKTTVVEYKDLPTAVKNIDKEVIAGAKMECISADVTTVMQDI